MNSPRLFGYLISLIFSFLLLVDAQTVTTTNAAGQTVIEVITVNPAGVPTTQTINTVPAAATTAATTATTTPAAPDVPGVPGVVAQPQPSRGTPGAPTPFTYTTIVNGVTNVVVDTFTPTSPKTTPVTASAIGTIYDYSSWVAVYGQPNSAIGQGLRRSLLEGLWLSLVVGVAGWVMLL